MRPRFLDGTWNLGVQGGPLFATGTYHRYFYAVEPGIRNAGAPGLLPWRRLLGHLSVMAGIAVAWVFAESRSDVAAAGANNNLRHSLKPGVFGLKMASR